MIWCKSSDGTQTNQSCKDEGPVTFARSANLEEEVSAKAVDFLDRNDPKKTGKPFFLYHNTVRMHVNTILSQKYLDMLGTTGGKDWGINEAGYKEMDDNIGVVLKKLEDMSQLDNTIIVWALTAQATSTACAPRAPGAGEAEPDGDLVACAAQVEDVLRHHGEQAGTPEKVRPLAAAGVGRRPDLLAGRGEPPVHLAHGPRVRRRGAGQRLCRSPDQGEHGDEVDASTGRAFGRLREVVAGRSGDS